MVFKNNMNIKDNPKQHVISLTVYENGIEETIIATRWQRK